MLSVRLHVVSHIRKSNRCIARPRKIERWRDRENDLLLSSTNSRRNGEPMKSFKLDRQNYNSSASYFLACRVSSQFNGRNAVCNFLLFFFSLFFFPVSVGEEFENGGAFTAEWVSLSEFRCLSLCCPVSYFLEHTRNVDRSLRTLHLTRGRISRSWF